MNTSFFCNLNTHAVKRTSKHISVAKQEMKEMHSGLAFFFCNIITF